LAINGSDVMAARGIKPGKQVGEALKMLLECVTEAPELNTREGLLGVLASMMAAHPTGAVERRDAGL
jgi:tRNA nucleotidyltransferase (CCA-adding enzyme)